MGVQSFNDELLHLASDVDRAWTLLQEMNFDWVNLDLMCGLIGEGASAINCESL